MTTENLINDPLADSEVRNLYVLSGGGARFAWQFNVLKLLISAGYKPYGMTGTSTGTLGCFLYVEDLMEEGEELMNLVAKTNAAPITKPGLAKIENGKVVANIEHIEDTLFSNISVWDFAKLITKSGRKKVLSKVLDNAKSVRSLMDNQPLKDTLMSLLSKNKPGKRVPFTFNTVSLRSGRLIRNVATEFTSHDSYSDALVASTSVPGLWPGRDGAFDGGIREGTGLAALFDEINPAYRHRIFVLSCNRRGVAATEDIDNLLKIIGRTGKIMMDESSDNDLSLTLYKNKIAKEYGEKIGQMYTPIHIIEYSGDRGVMEFTEESFADQIKTAQDDISKYLAVVGQDI